MAGVAGVAAEVGAAAERTSVEAGVEEVAEERPSAVVAAVASVAAAWEVAAHQRGDWAARRWTAHSPAAETSGHASAASAVEAMTSHKVAGSIGGRFHGRHRHGNRFFVGLPFYGYGYYDYDYGYYGGCGWLYRRAIYTGSPYWWRRYELCIS